MAVEKQGIKIHVLLKKYILENIRLVATKKTFQKTLSITKLRKEINSRVPARNLETEVYFLRLFERSFWHLYWLTFHILTNYTFFRISKSFFQKICNFGQILSRLGTLELQQSITLKSTTQKVLERNNSSFSVDFTILK